MVALGTENEVKLQDLTGRQSKPPSRTAGTGCMQITTDLSYILLHTSYGRGAPGLSRLIYFKTRWVRAIPLYLTPQYAHLLPWRIMCTITRCNLSRSREE